MDANWECWNRNAGSYDRDNVKGNDEVYGKLESLLGRYLTRDMEVLELASGSGNLAIALASSVSSWRGVDYSDEMVDESNNIHIPNAVFETGDVQELRFTDSSFDAVVFINALQVIPNPMKSLKEARRVLKKDGLLLCSAILSTTAEEASPVCHHWDGRDVLGLVDEAGFLALDYHIIISSDECIIFVKAERM